MNRLLAAPGGGRANMTDRCVDCAGPFPPYSAMRTQLMRQRGLVRRSQAEGQEDRCVGCARSQPGYNSGHRTIPPFRTLRYCACPGYRRSPDCFEMCQFCYRRIHPRYDHRIPEEMPS